MTGIGGDRSVPVTALFMNAGRIGRHALAAGLLLLAACSREAAPAPAPPALPVLGDLSLDRDCRCVIAGECAVADSIEVFAGQSETRGFQCRWEDRAAGRATCAFESRSKPDEPPSRWTSWSRTTVRLRHAGERGWCWTDRTSQNELTR